MPRLDVLVHKGFSAEQLLAQATSKPFVANADRVRSAEGGRALSERTVVYGRNIMALQSARPKGDPARSDRVGANFHPREGTLYTGATTNLTGIGLDGSGFV